MAKPLSPSSAGSSAASTSSSCNAQNASAHSNHPRHRRRRRPKPSSSVTPSSGLLVLLASVASASNVSGSPAPPAFLCPSIDEDDDCDLPSEASSSIPETTPSPSAFLAASGRHLPDKFSRDSDGVWRRVPSYTLYGSTVSVDCDNSCMQPTEVASPADDQIQDGVVNPISNSTANATSTYDIRNSLPPGWKPVAKPYESRTPLILSVSLVLALFICFFIFGCLFWRTSVKKKHRSNDVEAKARKLPGGNDTRELVEKEVKAKQKIWARATARWRANARYSARQRRGKRLGSRLSYAHQSNVSVDRPHSRLADWSLHRSRESSRRASVVFIPDHIDNSETINTSSPSQRQIADSLPPLLARTSSPPAYQHRGQPAMPLFLPSNTSSEQQPSNPTSDPSRRQPYRLPCSPSESIDDDQNAQLTDSTSLHVAHVATDDKTILARLAELASSPPDASCSVGVTDVQVSAPVWDDEDVRDLVPDLMLAATQSSDPAACTSAPMFPPPPSKERLAAAERYAYPFSFDDMETLEVEAGPSAPPFQEDPSHHPSHSHMLPSAPPLLDTDEFPQGFHPSAPDWDSITRHNPTEEDAPGQNHDRISTESSVIGPSTSPVHLIPRPTDNIALPGYQP